MTEYAAVVATPLPQGTRLGWRYAGGLLCELDFLPATAPLRAPNGHDARALAEQLQRYWEEPCRGLSQPLVLHGTEFQRRVWQALQALQAGQSLTYGQLARHLDSGARAVAAACRDNPLPLLVPCHRVVAAQGVGGFMGMRQGLGPALKQWLLQHESRCRNAA